MTLSQYTICFILYGFFGWIYESMFYTVQFKKFVNTGFLKGCFCPIYGLACVGNIMLLNGIESNIAMFFISMIVISLIEYIVSYILENIFDKRWWDYSDWPGNINGRISLISSLGFGIMSVAQMKILQPMVMLLINKLSFELEMSVILVFCAIFCIDAFVTLRNLRNKADDDSLWFVSEEPVVIQKTSEKLEAQKKIISDRYNNVRDKIKDKFDRW